MAREKNEWYCEHCGEYFPALTFEDVCPCGAKVDTDAGYARSTDGHSWTPPGATRCEKCGAA